MSKYTPGPWEMSTKPYVIESTGEGDTFSDGDWGIYPPDAPPGEMQHGGPIAIVNSEANARLIAAAPELLEAARLAVKNWHSLYDVERRTAMDALEATIANATGEES